MTSQEKMIIRLFFKKNLGSAAAAAELEELAASLPDRRKNGVIFRDTNSIFQIISRTNARKMLEKMRLYPDYYPDIFSQQWDFDGECHQSSMDFFDGMESHQGKELCADALFYTLVRDFGGSEAKCFAPHLVEEAQKMGDPLVLNSKAPMGWSLKSVYLEGIGGILPSKYEALAVEYGYEA